jgi:CRP-like cAMP-binding protein
VLYGAEKPTENVYLMIDGKVKLCRQASGGRPVIADIYQADEFFGESAFVGSAERGRRSGDQRS